MQRREILWMIFPCLFFAMVAFFLNSREARLPVNDPTGPFHLVIDKVETRPISAKDASEGYDTEVVAILNYGGMAPRWWGTQSGTFGDGQGEVLLNYEAGDKKSPVKQPPDYKEKPQIFYWRPGWKKESERYEARFFLKLAELPRRAEKTVLRGKITIEDSSVSPATKLCEPVPFAFTVRGANQLVAMPKISKDPGLAVRQIEIKKYSAAEQKTTWNDTQVRVRILDTANKGSGDAQGSDRLVDEKGQDITFSNGWSMSSGHESVPASSHQLVLTYSFRLKLAPASAKNIFLKTKFSRADRWPLRLLIPLRRNGKDLSGIVQALPAKD